MYPKAIGSGEASEAMASPVFKLEAYRPKQMDFEIDFACGVYLFVCLWGIYPVL